MPNLIGRQPSLLFVIAFAPIACAQFGTELLPDQDVGRPPQPPFISFLGIANPGKMLTDPSLPPKGKLQEVLLEELRTQTSPGGAAGEVLSSVKTKYDESGRPIEETRKGLGSETVTINTYQGARLVSQETTFLNAKRPQPKFWNYWTFDASGKITEFKRGSGDTLQNHDVNFKRDAQGRLLSYEYRQGSKDELFSRTEYRYSPDGRTVDINAFDDSDQIINTTTQFSDTEGRVIKVVVRAWDWETKKLKPPVSVEFEYDKQGRLLAQIANTPDFNGPGVENELPPGKITINYDDQKHTKTTAYSGKEGSISSTLTLNDNGETIAIALKADGATVDAHLECTFDDHQNWTSCRQIAQEENKTTVSKSWRRTITYRK